METRPQDDKGEAGTVGFMDTAEVEMSPPETRTNPLPSPEIRLLTRTHSVGSNARAHSRSASLNPSSASKHRNRLSLSFPVNPSAVTSPRYAAPSTVASPLSPAISGIAAVPTNLDPTDSSSFLTALAAQERKVLELKEELSKAESELSRMQHQWAIHEGKRKRKEIAMMERMRRSGEFSGASGAESIPASGDESARSEEQQLREQIMRRKLAAQKAMNRRSFPGQKHTRTLSLLSPQFNQAGSSSEQAATPQEEISSPSYSSEPPTARSSTSDGRPSRVLSFNDFPLAPKAGSQQVIIQTGKQIAEDFKEGLWTFIEDLRQATVGDEAASESPSSSTHSPGLRHQSSRSSIRSHSSRSSRSADSREHKIVTQDGDFFETGWQEPKKARVPHSCKKSDIVKEAEEEDESKVSTTRWSTSTVFSDAPSLVSSHSRASTRSSISSASDTNEINNGGGQLLWGFNIKKTATAILNSVEKTLAPPLPEEYTTQQQLRRKPSLGRMSS